MKKMVTFITVLIMMLTLVACSITDNENVEINNLSEVLNIKISQESILEKKDTENGFISLKVTDTKTVEEIKSEWKELPLTENLTALVYGLEDETSSIGPYISKDGVALFPEVENGYYYFYDRHSESTDHFDDTNVFDRHSFNFVIAIFDTDTNRLYYSRFDT
ncbi:MAG: hypothetical protein ACLRQ9_00905 [Coprococcus sp.]|jgi:hypothetical protein|uniref:hypothetical protein n=1 Tax=Hominenteromicrobium sp. TaxID=3073581 RepID=UPI002E9EDBE5|nr:hypothetical protein [Coprococcus sp.]